MVSIFTPRKKLLGELFFDLLLEIFRNDFRFQIIHVFLFSIIHILLY